MTKQDLQPTTTTAGAKPSEAVANEGLAPARASGIADPEVVPKATRRTYTAEYKLDILKRVALCEHGQVGALLRQEGLYFAQLSAWRAAAAQGLEPIRRGPKPKHVELNAAELVELAELRRKNAALERQLKKAQIIIEIQKKVAMLMGTPLADQDLDATS
jgi:transposase-like protein